MTGSNVIITKKQDNNFTGIKLSNKYDNLTPIVDVLMPIIIDKNLDAQSEDLYDYPIILSLLLNYHTIHKSLSELSPIIVDNIESIYTDSDSIHIHYSDTNPFIRVSKDNHIVQQYDLNSEGARDTLKHIINDLGVDTSWIREDIFSTDLLPKNFSIDNFFTIRSSKVKQVINITERDL